MHFNTVILGGGISGLAVAYELAKYGQRVCLLEKTKDFGGLARTVSLGGQLFDIGPHAMYFQGKRIFDWVSNLIGSEMRETERKSFIVFNRKLVPFPLAFIPTIQSVRFADLIRIIAEIVTLKQSRPNGKKEMSFKKWATSHFGKTIFRLFFQDYTQKVWGVPCEQLSSRWIASQLPANSLLYVFSRLLRKRSLPIHFVDKFYYCNRGAGHLVQRLEKKLKAMKSVHLLSCSHATEICKEQNRWVVSLDNGQLPNSVVTCKDIVSTIPLSDILGIIPKTFPPSIADAARGLKFRNLILVLLVIDQAQISRANWVYIPDHDNPISRISECKNFMSSLTDRPDTSIELEIPCWPTDPAWTAPDRAIMEQCTVYMERRYRIGTEKIKHMQVIRVPNAYPVFKMGFQMKIEKIRCCLEGLGNLHFIGRTGTFQYKDMVTCIDDAIELAARLAG